VTAGPTATKAAARAQAENRKAIAAAKTAYNFVPNSFTYCLSAASPRSKRSVLPTVTYYSKAPHLI
jgi:hypothetical protein